MSPLNRRAFVQLSTGALLAAASGNVLGEGATPRISRTERSVRVDGSNYSWEYSQADDTFHLRDGGNRLIVSGTMQPAVIVASAGQAARRRCSLGVIAGISIAANRLRVEYAGVNGGSHLSISWRFDEHGLWMEPIVYRSASAEDIVRLHYFAEVRGTTTAPSLHSSFFVVPGLCESPAVSPIVHDAFNFDQNVWLGHGSSSPGTLHQQWGLPVHYFCGFSADAPGNGIRDEYAEGMSDAFACGLADLPAGDLFLNLHEGRSSLRIDYRSDLWKQLQGPGRLTLGATLYWAIGANYYDAIGQYYRGLMRANIIRRKTDSARKTAAALTPQFCTWGSQVDRGKRSDRLDEAFLTEIYRELRASGMKAGMFSIDDKWEGSYGRLEHSTERFPHFEQFLEQARADGYRVGLWAALMRCEHPSELGLTTDNMLQRPDGTPFIAGGDTKYYILDFTQPLVAKVAGDIARKFIRRYKPDLVKFDFGYEMPSLADGAPQDKSWAGERLMWKGLDVAVRAMKEENPDLVVMYYQLSPLFLDYFDLHSPDDLYLAVGEYDLEANRRFFFSSLLGILGVPTYGSSGYDWASAPNIWFDSAAVGTLGSLNDFRADEQGEGSTPERIAKYNGLIQTLRTSNIFKIVPLDTVYAATTRGAHARSWARMEEGQLVLLALRPPIPGDENPLASRFNRADILEIVQCGMPVVVASRNRDDITRCSQLAVVAYGSGEIAIHRRWGRRADVLCHYLGGGVVRTSSTIENGRLQWTVEEHDAAHAPLEWVEINIS